VTASERARADEAPDDVDGTVLASTVVALLIGLAVGFFVAMWLQVFHWAGQGRMPW
jgi:H+/Cl- antiporter ClcA